MQRTFNGLTQLTNEYQSHSGAVNTSTTPQVQYAYTEMSSSQNNSRLTQITYPSNNYTVSYNYNSGLDSNISRLSSISDSANTLESYKYLGLATVVERDHPQNNVNLSYFQQTGDNQANMDGGDQYTGLDRFGRVIDQNWLNGTTQTSTDRFQYGYNQDGDVLYRQNLVNAVMSELYSYDNLHQLTSFQRGTLNATHDGIVGTPSRSQGWTLDALGNFTSVTTGSSTQTRTHNQQNEITSISGAGAVTYDANGNTTADGSGNTFVYDAWNRLVAIKNASTTLAAYGYDGLGRRITATHGSTTTDLYYSAGWQVLEEQQGGAVQARYVWSPAGVDTLVLRDYSTQHNGVLDQRLYVQQDANANVTALVDTSGNVVERYAYDAYGAVTVLNPDFSVRGASSYSWNYFFQGKRYDGAVSLYDSRGRVYSPTLMRPLQADPLGLAPDNNDYRWEGDGPTGAMDPSGTQQLNRHGFRLYMPPFWLPHPAGHRLLEHYPWVPTGVYVAHTQWRWMIDPVGHRFIIIDGEGYGYFQVQNWPFGEGRVRTSDLDTYPLKTTSVEISHVPFLAWYSELDGEVYVNVNETDPVLFKKAVREFISRRTKNPGDYNLFINNCNHFVVQTLYSSTKAAWTYKYEYEQRESWFGTKRTEEEEIVAKIIRGSPYVTPVQIPLGWTLGDIDGNIPEATYQPPSQPTQYTTVGYTEVSDLEGGWYFEPIVVKQPQAPIADPWEGVEP